MNAQRSPEEFRIEAVEQILEQQPQRGRRLTSKAACEHT